MTLRAVPSTIDRLSTIIILSMRATHAASVLLKGQSVLYIADVAGWTHGVRTISAPRARSITSFSKLIFAGRVIMHLTTPLLV